MEQKARVNVRTRKALERERKKQNKIILKETAKLALKKVCIAIAVIFAIFVGFFVIELIRFNKADGCKPGICAVKVDIDSEAKTITYKGIGYTFTYKYSELKTNEDIDTKRIGGEFKLFGKKLIAAWVI